MAQLNNPKHELMARLRAKGRTKTDCYLATHPKASLATARSNASAYMEKYGINARAAGLLLEAGLTDQQLARRLKELVESDAENISLEATKFGFKMLGYGRDKDPEPPSYNPVAINIIVRKGPEAQDEPPKAIELKPEGQEQTPK